MTEEEELDVAYEGSKQEEEAAARRRRYEDGYSCEKCKEKHFTNHPIPYGLDMRCINCGHVQDMQW